MTGSTGSPPAGSRRRRKRPPKRVRFRGNREAPSKGELPDTVMMHQASQGVKMKIAPGDVREFVSGGEGGTPRSDEVRTMEHPRCRRLPRAQRTAPSAEPACWPMGTVRLSDAVARARAPVERGSKLEGRAGVTGVPRVATLRLSGPRRSDGGRLSRAAAARSACTAWAPSSRPGTSPSRPLRRPTAR